MTASEPKRSTGDFSLTSAAGPYMTNSIRPLSAQRRICRVFPLASVQKPVPDTVYSNRPHRPPLRALEVVVSIRHSSYETILSQGGGAGCLCVSIRPGGSEGSNSGQRYPQALQAHNPIATGGGYRG